MTINVACVERHIMVQTSNGQTAVCTQLFELRDVLSIEAREMRSDEFDTIEHELGGAQIHPFKVRELAGCKHASVAMRAAAELHRSFVSRAAQTRVFNALTFCDVRGNPLLGCGRSSAELVLCVPL